MDYQCRVCGVTFKSLEMLLEHYYLHVKLIEFVRHDQNGLNNDNDAYVKFVNALKVIIKYINIFLNNFIKVPKWQNIDLARQLRSVKLTSAQRHVIKLVKQAKQINWLEMNNRSSQQLRSHLKRHIVERIKQLPNRPSGATSQIYKCRHCPFMTIYPTEFIIHLG